MGKVRSFLGNLSAILYFIVFMIFIIIYLFYGQFHFISLIKEVLDMGFYTSFTAMASVSIIGLLIAISLLVPPLRKMYYKLPWLFPYIKILFINIIILSIALYLINMGYEVQNETRHHTFFIIMIVQIIACRLAMCLYFYKKPAVYIKEGK